MNALLTEIWAYLQPHLITGIGIIVATFVAQAAAALRRWTGVQISQRHADRLSQAITRAATLALARQLDGDAAKGLVMDYLRETVPEALAAVGPAWPALALRIEASLAEVGRR